MNTRRRVALVACAAVVTLSGCKSSPSAAKASTTSSPPPTVQTTTPAATTPAPTTSGPIDDEGDTDPTSAAASPTAAVPSATSTKPSAPATSPPPTPSATPTASAPPSPTGQATPTADGKRGPGCLALTSGAASAALGTPVSVKLDPKQGRPGTSLCDILQGSSRIGMVALASNASVAIFKEYLSTEPDAKPISGVGQQAATTTLGVDALTGKTLIQERGPQAAVASGDYSKAIALTKAVVAALS